MTIPWQKIGTIAGLIVSSAITTCMQMVQSKKMIADMGQSIGKEVLKTVEKETIK